MKNIKTKRHRTYATGHVGNVVRICLAQLRFPKLRQSTMHCPPRDHWAFPISLNSSKSNEVGSSSLKDFIESKCETLGESDRDGERHLIVYARTTLTSKYKQNRIVVFHCCERRDEYTHAHSIPARRVSSSLELNPFPLCFASHIWLWPLYVCGTQPPPHIFHKKTRLHY